MGAAPSRDENQIQNERDMEIFDEIENKRVVVDKTLTNNLNTISDIVTQFSQNDTQAIVNKIKSMPEFKGKLPDAVLQHMSDAHRSILDTIDSSLSETDRKKLLQNDSAIAGFIEQYVDKDMDTKMKNYLQNPFIKDDPVVKKTMEDVTGSIKSIRSKYKYFEYKYVQMNLFLVVFTKHIYDVMNKFIDDTVGFYEAREKYHLVLIRNVIKTFQQQLGDETKNLTSLDTSSFTKAINELAASVMDGINKQKDLGTKLKEDSLNEILSFLMSKEKDFAIELIKSVDNYKATAPAIGQNNYNPYTASPSGIGASGTGQTSLVSNDTVNFIPSSLNEGDKYKGYKFRPDGSLGSGYYRQLSEYEKQAFTKGYPYIFATYDQGNININYDFLQKGLSGMGYYLKLSQEDIKKLNKQEVDFIKATHHQGKFQGYEFLQDGPYGRDMDGRVYYKESFIYHLMNWKQNKGQPRQPEQPRETGQQPLRREQYRDQGPRPGGPRPGGPRPGGPRPGGPRNYWNNNNWQKQSYGQNGGGLLEGFIRDNSFVPQKFTEI